MPQTLLSIAGSASFPLGANRPDGKPPHLVQVPGFEIADRPITRAGWRSVRQGATGYALPFGAAVGPLHAVTDVSWLDVAAWMNAASEADGLTPCYRIASSGEIYRGALVRLVVRNRQFDGYHLPTELQWEYAARGGSLARPGDEWPGATGGVTRDEVGDFRPAIQLRGCDPRVPSMVYPLAAAILADPTGHPLAIALQARFRGPDNPTYTVADGWPHVTFEPDPLPAGSKLPNSLGVRDCCGYLLEWTESALPVDRDYDDTADYRALLFRVVRGGVRLPNAREVARITFRMPNLGARVARG